MKIKPIGKDKYTRSGHRVRNYASNMTLLELNNGTEILFSYSTPVAGYYRGEANNAVLDHEYFKTDEWYSSTTTRHINKYLDGVKAVTIEQEEIDSMMSH